MIESTISLNNIYEIKLPKGYLINVDKEITTIYNEENGKGAISITTYKIPIEFFFDINVELRDFANSIDKNLNTQNLLLTVNQYAYSEFITEHKFWKIFVFFKNQNAVFMTYNCEIEHKNYEMNEVNNIAESLKIM